MAKFEILIFYNSKVLTLLLCSYVSLETTTGISIENKLLDLFGYDTEAHKWREGLLCDTPGKDYHK